MLKLPNMERNDEADLGAVGRLYSCHMVLGFYRCTALLAECSYSTSGISDPDSWFIHRFDQALHQTVQDHPILCYGIVDQTPEKEAHFLRLPAIYRDDVAEFESQSDDPESNNSDQVIVRLLEKSHTRRLLEGHRKPSWRIVVMKHGENWSSNNSQPVLTTQKLSLAFLANHAIADGLSHANFFRSFFRSFNNPQGEKLSWPLVIPKDIRHPLVIENAVDLTAQDENDRPPPLDLSANIWTGEDISLDSVDKFESGVRLITVSQGPLGDVLQFCKAHKITLTGLLNSLIITYLSRAAPKGYGFRFIIPYSMRHKTKVSENEICNHASVFASECLESLVSKVGSAAENSSEEIELMVKMAQELRQDVADELARCPKNNILAGMVGVKDWYALSKSQLGTKRTLTYGMSNLGNIPVVEQSEDALLTLERLIISQPGSVTGPIFGFQCISIPKGPLCITLSWQKGVVADQFIDDLAVYMSRRLMSNFAA